jgi:hypothetical protein
MYAKIATPKTAAWVAKMLCSIDGSTSLKCPSLNINVQAITRERKTFLNIARETPQHLVHRHGMPGDTSAVGLAFALLIGLFRQAGSSLTAMAHPAKARSPLYRYGGWP